MKKILGLMLTMFFVLASSAFGVAGLGTAAMAPTAVINGQTGVFVSMTITAGVGGLASFSVTLPPVSSTQAFTLSGETNPGYITATAGTGTNVAITLSETDTVACISFGTPLLVGELAWVYIGGTTVGLTIDGVGLYTWTVKTLDVGADCSTAADIVTMPEMVIEYATATVTETAVDTRTYTPTFTITPTVTMTVTKTITQTITPALTLTYYATQTAVVALTQTATRVSGTIRKTQTAVAIRTSTAIVAATRTAVVLQTAGADAIGTATVAVQQTQTAIAEITPSSTPTALTIQIAINRAKAQVTAAAPKKSPTPVYVAVATAVVMMADADTNYARAATLALASKYYNDQARYTYSRGSIRIEQFKSVTGYVTKAREIPRMTPNATATAYVVSAKATIVAAEASYLQVAETPIAALTPLVGYPIVKNKKTSATNFIAEVRAWIAAH